MLVAEVFEGAQKMKHKEFVQEWGGGTAMTLRLTRPYWGQGKIVVGDSWFGSTRCAYNLLLHSTFAVLNVKTAHKGFPKDILKAACTERGSVKHMRLTTQDGYELYASCHRDIQPMALVHTCLSSEQGEPRFRRFA